jgi:RNA polymerase sigma factor (sigma-70 family)
MTANKSAQFTQILDDHKGVIYKIVNAYCQQEADREDLAQEVCFQLWKSFDNYDPAYKYSTWIYRIALNVAISFQRKNRTRAHLRHVIDESLFQISSVNEQPQSEALQALHLFLGALNPFDRALMLLYLDEKPHREIAEILGISETNVSTKVNRIKTNLKQFFKKS